MNEKEVLSILENAYNREDDLRSKIEDFILTSDLYIIFMNEAFNCLEGETQFIEAFISRWTLTFCVQMENYEVEAFAYTEMILFRSILYSLISEEEEDQGVN